MSEQQLSVRDALALLGVDRLVLAIHDQSFPSLPDQESGRGSPYSAGAREFVSFLSALGFNAIQLGPQGKTSRTNPSPYDSTLFSKNELSIDPFALTANEVWGNLLDGNWLKAAIARSPAGKSERDYASYQFAFDLLQQALQKAQKGFFDAADQNNRVRKMDAYNNWVADNSYWLEPDTRFEALLLEHGTDDWRHWPDRETTPALLSKYKDQLEGYRFQQFIVHMQHAAFRKFASESGIKLFADLQIGFSQRDFWCWRQLFLPGYLLGAPPSRTNPDGQPWGYPVLNPDLYFESDGSSGEVLRWFSQRIDKLLLDFDGVRVDHPHGIVCPWVYKDVQCDALRAVQQGARLFESPESAEHGPLKKFAIARPDQLAHRGASAPYADGWVSRLDENQVERYGTLIQLIRQRMAARGFDNADMICEVLSSCPYPLRRVLDLYQLGRFRVTQKAQPANANDVYRSDNSQPADWIMVGTHDTKPLWLVADGWTAQEREGWAVYLAERLARQPDKRAELVAKLRADKKSLIEAMFADLFIGPARNVSIFFPDLLGMKETYNRPGIVDAGNWTLSVPNNYKHVYDERCKNQEALSLPRVLLMALRARFGNDNAEANAVIERLVRS
jgi:4-alpha-glucanotransferase